MDYSNYLDDIERELNSININTSTLSYMYSDIELIKNSFENSLSDLHSLLISSYLLNLVTIIVLLTLYLPKRKEVVRSDKKYL